MIKPDERTPIRERWISRSPGPSDEAIAGALLRAATRTTPLSDERLAEIHARLRQDKGARPGWGSRPVGRWLRPVVAAALLIVFGGALSAAVSHVFRPAPDHQPAIIPTVRPTVTKPAARRPHAKAAQPEVPAAASQPVATETPGLPASASATEAPVVVRNTEPSIPRAPLVPLAPSIRLPKVHRPLASRDTRDVPRIDRATPALVPAVVPPAQEPAPVVFSPPAPSELARESRLLAGAIAKLRRDGDAEAALRLLDEYRTTFASGVLRAEATATRIEALLRLGRNPQALALLEAQPLSATGVGREMIVARAELRADSGRYPAALADFDRLLSPGAKADPVVERALYGRAACRAKGGDWNGARRDFLDYQARFPRGRFIALVRAVLAREEDR